VAGAGKGPLPADLSHHALRLARYCLDRKIELEGLEQVMLIGEIAGAGVREACRRAWGASVADIYSAREIGYIALQCPEAGCLHVQSEGVLAEVLDEAGEPCAPGEVGRVVLTPLHNFAMPLIRYDIGDYAEVGAPCRCGRGLPVLRRVLGRQQNMIVLPSGERRWTLLSSGNIEGLLELAPIRQYQFAQVARDAIQARLAVVRPLSAAEESAIRSWLIARLGHPFAVAFAYVDAIPRTKGGKYLDFVSEL
jgi:phenylacetate-CoA ligase